MVNYAFDVRDLYKEKRILQKDVEIIQDWALLQNNIPQINSQIIAIFLIGCDNNVEMVKNCILGYYSLRNATPELFSDRNTQNAVIVKQLESLNLCFIPKRTKENQAIIIKRLTDSTPSKYCMDIAMKYLFMVYDGVLYRNPPDGYIVLFDMANTSLRHAARTQLGLLKVIFKYVQDYMPMKIHHIHIMNSLWFLPNFIRIMKPFMNKELMSKVCNLSNTAIHSHLPNNLDDFHEKYIPKSHLPEEYGGELPPIQELHDETFKYLTFLNEHFYEEEIERKN